MKNPLELLHLTLLLGLVLAIVALLLLHTGIAFSSQWWLFFFRWVHVLAAILWIGLLYYFNFVQIPSMPKIPDEQKPAIGKVIAPAALFWFRWAAAGNGAVRAAHRAYQRLFVRGAHLPIGRSYHRPGHVAGADHGLQRLVRHLAKPETALGHCRADADTKKRSGRTAMLSSRINTMLSIPMLYCMVAQQNIPGV